jgi:hypothetical protein
MKFSKIECTGPLLGALNAPVDLENRIRRDPIGSTFVYSQSDNAALFAHPFDHSTYPDQVFTLVVDGEALWVWEKVQEKDKAARIEVFVSKETERFDDQFLVDLVREAFSAWKNDEQFSLPISIRNRSRSPKAPRNPEQIIAALNKFMTLMPPGTEDLVDDLFVPALVRPEEIDDFVAFGRRNGFEGLGPEARSLFGPVLRKLERGGE